MRVSKEKRFFLQGALFAAAAVFGIFAGFSCKVGGAVVGNKEVSESPRLTALTFESELTLNPEFEPWRFVYHVDLPDDGSLPLVKLSAEAEEGYTVRYLHGDEFTPFNGMNAIVSVISPEGWSTNYVIVFARGRLPEAKISNIELSTGPFLGFSPDITSYTVPVPYGTKNVTVNAEGAQDGSSIAFDPPNVTTPIINGSGTVVVRVFAHGYEEGSYTVNFIEAPPETSHLGGVTLSSGALTTQTGIPAAFNAEPAGEQYITVTEGTTRLIVQAQKQNFKDSVFFSEGGMSSDGVIGVIEDEASLEGKLFSITVNNGAGFSDSVYNFRICTAAKEPAYLSALSFSGGDLYQRDNAAGANGAAAFSESHTAYNLSFTHGTANVGIQAAAESGYSVSINGEDLSALSINNPRAAEPPLTITVSAPDKLSTAYTVYLVKSNPPPALLSALSVSGGTLTRAFTPSDHGPYTADVFANTHSVIIRGTGAESDFSVSCLPRAVFTPPANAVIDIEVDGGPDYTPTSYRLVTQVMGIQIPRLSTLSIDEESITLVNDTLVYQKTIPYAVSSPRDIPMEWTVNESEVEEVAYSFNGGQTWLADSGMDGFSGELSMRPGETAVVSVKIKTFDGNMVIYYLTVRRDAPTSSLISLSYDYGTGEKTPDLGELITTVVLPSFVDSLTVSASPIGLGSGAVVTVSPSTLTWTEDDLSARFVIVNARDDEGTDRNFVVNFTKKTLAATRMADGGEISFFRGGGGWYEIHRFTANNNTTTSGQLAVARAPAAATTRALIVAGGGGGGWSGGGQFPGGGGGAGGYIERTAFTLPANEHSVSVGAGGAGGTGVGTGANGAASSFNSWSAMGGGGGGSHKSGDGRAGVNGGSGGGGQSTNNGIGKVEGAERQGYNGGAGNVAYCSSGGGGAGADGNAASANAAGGAGKSSDISGASLPYAGGGGGGKNNSDNNAYAPGAGGAGGGGANGGNNGLDGLGGGGGGGRGGNGGRGGSGVVIVRFLWEDD